MLVPLLDAFLKEIYDKITTSVYGNSSGLNMVIEDYTTLLNPEDIRKI